VSNRHAELVVRTCFTMVSTFGLEDGPQWRATAGRSGLNYQQRIRYALRHSGLAQLLPAGTDLLPDYYGSLAPQWAPLARWVRPRNYRQLLFHLAENLDWYLEPARPARPTSDLMRLAIVIGVLPAGVVYFLLPLAISFMPALFFGLLSIPVGLLVMAALTRHSSHEIGYYLKREINAVELFRYLAEAYSDPPDELRTVPQTESVGLTEGELAELRVQHQSRLTAESQ